MKRKLAVLLSTVLSVGMIFSGCGSQTAASKSSSSAAAESGSTAASSTSAASSKSSSEAKSTSGDKQLKVALVVNQPFGDNGPMDGLAAGAQKAADEFGIELAKVESDTATFEDDIRSMCDQGYDLIVTTFGYMQDATVSMAQEYPDTKFCAVYQDINEGDTKYSNIWDVGFRGQEAFYIAGYMAGLYTKTNKIGIQVGAEEPTPNAEGNGFMSGVKDANPDAVCEFAYAGGYGDPATAKEKASAMITDGCDFIQNDSGASNAGVVEAAKSANILTAGEITDFWDTYQGFVGIIDIGFGNVAYEAMQDLVNDEFKGGEHSDYGLKEGGYVMNWDSYERFAKENTDFEPVLEKGKEVEQQIKDGKITVDYNTETPSWDAIAAK